MAANAVAGAAKSKTVWLGLVITVFGYLQTNLPVVRTILLPSIGQDKIDMIVGAINIALGLGVIVVRFYTTQALADK